MEGGDTDFAHLAPEGDAAITRKRPDETRGGGEGGDGAAHGHDDQDGNHGGGTAFASRCVVEDLHVWIPERTRGTLKYRSDVDRNVENSDDDAEAEGTVEQSRH